MAYTATTTINGKKAQKIAPGVAMITGRIALSSYHATLAAITGISSRFKAIYTVIPSVSSTGVLPTWITASKALKCYVPNTGVEVANDVYCGTIDFVAFGRD